MRKPVHASRAGAVPALAALAILLTGGLANAGDSARRYEARPEASRIRIDGTSNLHDWDVTEGRLEGHVELGAAEAAPGRIPAPALAAIRLILPATSLKSGSGGLDRRMHDALEAGRHPEIRFVMTAAEPGPEPEEGAEAAPLTVTGELTVAGTAREVALPVTAELGEDGRLTLVTSATLKMSDFGISPPRALLGTLRTGDEVTVSVTWVLAPAEAGEEA